MCLCLTLLLCTLLRELQSAFCSLHRAPRALHNGQCSMDSSKSRPVLVVHTLGSRWINKASCIKHSSTAFLIIVTEKHTAPDVFNNTVLPQHIDAVRKRNVKYWFTVGEGVRKRHPMAGQLLKGPEFVDTVEYGLRPVDQPTAHLLQVAQHSDVAIWLHPGRGHPYYHHLWIRCHQLLLHSQTWRVMWWWGSGRSDWRREGRNKWIYKL